MSLDSSIVDRVLARCSLSPKGTMENDIITGVLALISTIATGGLGAALARARKGLRPLLGRRELRLSILCAPEYSAEVMRFRASLLAAGYQHVTMTHAATAAGGDAVLVWRPAPPTAAATIEGLRLASPMAVLVVYTLDRLDVRLDERSLLSNSPLRLRGDLATVAELGPELAAG